MLALRERSRALEGKLRSWCSSGRERHHQRSRAGSAWRCRTRSGGLLQAIDISLREDFTIPRWRCGYGTAPASSEFETVSEVRVFAEALGTYFATVPCSSGAWFSAQAADLRSLVYLPLRVDRPIGLLALGSWIHCASRRTWERCTFAARRAGRHGCAAISIREATGAGQRADPVPPLSRQQTQAFLAHLQSERRLSLHTLRVIGASDQLLAFAGARALSGSTPRWDGACSPACTAADCTRAPGTACAHGAPYRHLMRDHGHARNPFQGLRAARPAIRRRCSHWTKQPG